MNGKIINDIKTPPFVLSPVEGLRESFSTACKDTTPGASNFRFDTDFVVARFRTG
jgi:hypothetical protein